MGHTQTKELKKIPLGSGDIFVVEWDGKTIPEDGTIEVESNMIGRTKNGATITYSPEYYTAKSDDGKAKKSQIYGEEATFTYGNITWNGNTLAVLSSTARVSEKDGKRTVKIGGVSNFNGKKYLLRFLHTDPVDGDIRITVVGVNTDGWSAAFANNNETILNPKFECEPIDDDGTLIIYEEEIIEPSASGG